MEKVGNSVVFISKNEDITDCLVEEKPGICYIDASLGNDTVAICELLDLLHIDYVGSSAFARKMAQDPRLVVRNLESYLELSGEFSSAWAPEGVLITPEVLVLSSFEQIDAAISKEIPGGYPVFVKHVDSSVLAPVASSEEMKEVIAVAKESQSTLYVFQMIDGVRISIPVLGSGYNAYALAPVEQVSLIAPVRQELLSADMAVAQAIRSEMERAALDAYRVCGLKDYGCVEMVWDGARASIIGINAQPAFIGETVFGKACALAEISMSGLFDALLSE